MHNSMSITNNFLYSVRRIKVIKNTPVCRVYIFRFVTSKHEDSYIDCNVYYESTNKLICHIEIPFKGNTAYQFFVNNYVVLPENLSETVDNGLKDVLSSKRFKEAVLDFKEWNEAIMNNLQIRYLVYG